VVESRNFVAYAKQIKKAQVDNFKHQPPAGNKFFN